jgi:predicted glycogen debranching enzyme
LSPDATLWLFEVAREFMTRAPHSNQFLQNELYPALREACTRITAGKREWIWLTRDGLIENGSRGAALTWMDARVGSETFTPRHGLAIEMQALWVNGLRTLGELAARYEEPGVAAEAEALHSRAVRAFTARFWCEQTNYPFDCLSSDGANAWADPSLRPNALIALAMAPELFEQWQARAILERVDRELLTPQGIRSLAPSDRKYVGHFAGPMQEQLSSYHQGTVWPHLLAFYVRAQLALAPDDPELVAQLRDKVEHAVVQFRTLGHIAQIADGDPPHRPRGVPAQAASAAMLLRTLLWELSEALPSSVTQDESCQAG